VATSTAHDLERFYRQGATETDDLLAFCGIVPTPHASVLEIGCGLGRMTSRLSELFGRVLALDASAEMLARGQKNLAHRTNIEWLLGSGGDLAGVADREVDAVFSYITLQHVPSREGVLRYLSEASRVLAPSGRAGLQVRRPGAWAALLDGMGHVGHALQGRRTLAREWRGTRISERSLVDAVRSSDVDVELRHRGRRHLWVLLGRTDPLQEEANRLG
jgi:SAM-dependent methyltransferase